MNTNSRVQKSLKNMTNGILYRAISTLLSFVVRTVFIRCLSNEYLSVNGLYTSILSMLSLAELGMGTAMVYSMYKPLAEKDYRKLSQIMRLYKRVYSIIGTVIFGVGLCLIPFLDVLIKDKPDVSGLIFYYVLFLTNSALSYWFFAYRSSLLQADQRSYVVSNYNSLFHLIRSVAQIAVLVIFRNFTVYLLTEMVCTVVQNICIAIRAKKDYPVFDRKNKEELPKEEKQSIFKDVKALMLQKVSFKVLNTSDSLIISAFVGISWVGYLSNYLLVIDAVGAVLSQIVSAITASLGNFFAKESKESGYRLFQRVEFLNYWLYSFCGIAFVVLLNPFIELWLGRNGSEFVLSQTIVVALALRFFVEGYMNMMSTFRSTMGLFRQGMYFPLIVAAINIVLSIALSYPLGAAGVILATPLSRCCINVWYMPKVIHKDGFEKPVRPFYQKMFVHTLVSVGVTAALYALSSIVIFRNGVTILSFALMTVLVAIVPNLLYALIFCRTDEYHYLLSLVKDYCGRFAKRLKKT